MATPEIACLCNAAVYRSGLISLLEAGAENYVAGTCKIVAVVWLRADADEAGESGFDLAVEILRGDTIVTGRHIQVGFPPQDDEDFLPHYAVIHEMNVDLGPGIHHCRFTYRGAVLATVPFFVKAA